MMKKLVVVLMLWRHKNNFPLQGHYVSPGQNKELLCSLLFSDTRLESHKFMFKVIWEKITSMRYIHSTCSRKENGLTSADVSPIYLLPSSTLSIFNRYRDFTYINMLLDEYACFWKNHSLLVKIPQIPHTFI